MTSTGKHHKHPPLAKPTVGEWGRNEMAFLGAPCGVIRSMASDITGVLSDKWNVCFADAKHTDEQTKDEAQLRGGAYTDNIHSIGIELQDHPSGLQRRAMLSAYDVILVNGNHFTAQKQVVLLHSRKRESLERKLDRLTNVIAVVELDMTLDAYPFLKPVIGSDVPIFRNTEHDKFLSWLGEQIVPPEVRGLVLAGGKSLRMGSDKSLMEFHGMPQRQYMLKLFNELGLKAYLSCREDQVKAMQGEADLVQDRFVDMGPFGAILSAMLSAPDNAWLVVAADLPMVTQETLQQLLSHRNPSKIATAFHNPATGFPEPLITLWEPKAYPVLLSFLAQGISCPRKTLINSDVNVIEAIDPQWLKNVNTPEDAEAVRSVLERG